MKLEEIKENIQESDLLVEIIYHRKTYYELRDFRDIRKYTLTYNQFTKLKPMFRYDYSEGFGVRTHFYKKIKEI